MILNPPVPGGEGLLGDSGSQAKSEAEGVSGHQLPFIPICALCLGQKPGFVSQLCQDRLCELGRIP